MSLMFTGGLNISGLEFTLSVEMKSNANFKQEKFRTTTKTNPQKSQLNCLQNIHFKPNGVKG